MFSPSRDQVRQFFCTAWRKYQQQQPLEPMEQQAVAVILPHPEYRELLEDEAQALAREWPPEGGQMNPFLHLSLHLAIQEQLSIDQPPGIRDAYERLCRKLTDDHGVDNSLGWGLPGLVSRGGPGAGWTIMYKAWPCPHRQEWGCPSPPPLSKIGGVSVPITGRPL